MSVERDDDQTLHARNERVLDALRLAGITPRVRILDTETKTAVLAAAALGCEVAAIGNSLVFDCDGEPLLVIASGAHRVDTVALASRIGAHRIGRAAADVVLRATGQVIGGVAPVGHPSPLRTLVDESLREIDPIWTAAGTADSVMALTFDELVALTGGTVVRVD